MVEAERVKESLTHLRKFCLLYGVSVAYYVPVGQMATHGE